MKLVAYQIERDRRVLVARPKRAECTATDIASLVVELNRRIEQGDADSVVVDMSNVQHMDSCCLGRLMVLHHRARVAGGSVALARCQPNVEFLFKMTRLDKVLGLYDTTGDAIAELRDRRTRPKPHPRRSEATRPDKPPRPQGTRGYAPLLAALLKAHKRIHTRQPATGDRPLHPGPHS